MASGKKMELPPKRCQVRGAPSMDEAERIFWDEKRAKENRFVSTSPERVKIITTALEQLGLSAPYKELENCTRHYLLCTETSPYSCAKNHIKGCIRIFSDYESDNILEYHKNIHPFSRRYYLIQRLCNALQQWKWCYIITDGRSL